MSNDYIVGTFVREEKNRFLCIVNVNGRDEECYIPSSCRLENFLELTGKAVLLRENLNKNARTKLSVYAIRFKRNYIVLRTSEANEIIRNNINSRRFAYLGKRTNVQKECTIDGYKADLYIANTNTLIEVKSIISTGEEAVFPTVYSERALCQFTKIRKLLLDGYKVIYIFVSLNPYVKEVKLSQEEKLIEYKMLFAQCEKLGMLYKAYSAELRDGVPVIKKEISINSK